MTVVVKDNGQRKLDFDPIRLENFIKNKLFADLEILEEFGREYINKSVRQIMLQEEIDFRDINKILTENAMELVAEIENEDDETDPELFPNTNFQFVAKRALLYSMYKRASKNRSYDPDERYGDFFGLISTLGEKGLYHTNLLEDYSKSELQESGMLIDGDRDELLTYASLYHMSQRYVVRDKDKGRSIYELPQERFMIIALAVSRKEDRDIRMDVVSELYEVLSKLELTMATPTFSNAGRPDGQLSSCFVLTTADSLRSIYDDNTDIATLSKSGGGIGIYLGKVRARGSDIRGNQGASSGVIPWIKQLDNTATSVDQLGQRKGAIAVYLDVWHADILPFLELRLNTGDLNGRAHNVFTGLSLPDLFMKKVADRGDWYLFDPHQVRHIMGYSLEDFYDKYKLEHGEAPDKERHAFTYRYYECVDNNDLPKKRIPAIEIMQKVMMAQLETGLPYMFYRDTVNRDNPNSHKGMIYSSNLCTEIAQNQSPSEVVEEVIYGETVVITKTIGDFVTCNLSSLVYSNIIKNSFDQEDKERLQKVIRVAVRATDNVIDVNTLPVPQAVRTNERYRAIGIGEQGIASVLALSGIMYDSSDAVDFIAELEEFTMLTVIEASADLGKEKGSYKYYEGSQWNTGEWLGRKPKGDNLSSDWQRVIKKSMAHMRNGYLRAPAPTGSTSLLAGSTASIEAIFDIIHYDGKKDASIPVVVPELTPKSFYFYRPTMLMKYEDDAELGHMWSILQNEKRQYWVDQSSSFNTYIPDNIGARNFLRLHQETWDRGIKTSYYTRSHDADRADSCLACSS